MAIDYQKVRQQIVEFGKNAPVRDKTKRDLQTLAESLLTKNSPNQAYLQNKITQAVNLTQNKFYCAIPTNEELIETFPLPLAPTQGTVFTVDGSQILPDRNERVEYALINLGILRYPLQQQEPPQEIIISKLLTDEMLFTERGILSQEDIDKKRDNYEREVLADLAEAEQGTVFTFTDGPLEPWKASGLEFEYYIAALSRLQQRGAITAGYVDKPRSDLVIRLLELALLDDQRIKDAGKDRPFRGLNDRVLLASKLKPGERSAVFGVQNLNSSGYPDLLKIHFFYLNLSQTEVPYLARVEVPAWVANDKALLQAVHGLLYQQSQLIHSPESYYPYILHRAHEIAVVSYEEKAMVSTMIESELRKNGVPIGPRSGKQNLKDFSANKK